MSVLLIMYIGEFKIAAIYSATSNINFGIFTEAAINLVNRGYWDSDFPGMYFCWCEYGCL